MANKQEKLTITVLNEKGVLYFGDCQSLSLPTETDSITILPFHTPLIAKLGEGKVIVRTNRQKQEITTIKRGIVYVSDNEVTVLTGL